MIYIDSDGELNLSKLHENQQKFITSDKLHSGIVGGYQSGKSLAAVIKAITKQLRDPGVPIAYYLPTYGLIDDMLFPKFRDIFELLNISYTYNKTDSKIITPFGEIWMRSMDNPDRIVSYSVGYSMVDEVDVVHANKRIDAIKRISSRNSYKKSTKNSIDFVSTPEGYAYMYNFFVKTANENKELFVLKTLDNSENLGDGYIDGLREQYDAHQLKAYLDGEFINLSNSTVYYKFDRHRNNSNETLKPYDILFIGMDFNIGNMSGLVHVKRNNIPIAVDELTGIYDTEQMIIAIKEKYPTNKIIIYPDASGKQRQTNADKTDIQLLEQAKFKVKAKGSNPYVSDRVKNMNRMFLNGKNEVGYLVNVNMCPEYTEALERMPNDKNGVPDKTSGFDHITEAGGYFIYYEYPLKVRKSFTVKHN